MAPRGYRQLTGLSAAKLLSQAVGGIPDDANAVVIIANSQAVRWRDDGTAPTTAVGMHLATNTEFLYTGSLAAIQIIEEAASATVDLSFYKMVG